MWEVTREGINIVSSRSLLLLRILLERDLFPPYRFPPSLGQIAAAEEEEVQLAWGGKWEPFFLALSPTGIQTASSSSHPFFPRLPRVYGGNGTNYCRRRPPDLQPKKVEREC